MKNRQKRLFLPHFFLKNSPKKRCTGGGFTGWGILPQIYRESGNWPRPRASRFCSHKNVHFDENIGQKARFQNVQMAQNMKIIIS